MWIFGRKGASGFSATSTAEEVTEGIHGSGLTAIVTGATSGIGSETTRVLALRGVHVIMAVRNIQKAIQVKETILKDTPDAKVDVMELDLSSMASIRNFAAKYRSLGLPLHILINNAGVLSPQFKLSKDNIELHFATNHLGHFLLTNLLLETMKTTSYEQNTEGRIINVSSEGHRFAYSGHLSDYMNNELSSIYAYGLSKLANILHANELARLLKEDGVNITANSLHPGFIDTELFRGHNIFSSMYSYAVVWLITPGVFDQGAATTCYLALNPQVKGVTGEYFVDSNFAKPSLRAKDQELAKELWEFSMGLTSSK
ncbi:short-chain dehydrogenase TIC 32, chloroplastic isoform X3 [Helianthus annuus]|uniref:short-chain dehydrogenase TIC 32, chloroplastic isoform X3 n=1 Tax=Helianthus annuus TaxID=4232 RepID=UPI000B9083F3|nr:short-chain dehydrogenase TIC 32, chloroplastic isoform X3 [Helianthus annuus]